MHITPLGWIGIIIIVVIIVVLNLSLVALLRNRNPMKITRPPRTQTGMTVQKLGEVIRDPFGEEKRQLSELSHLVDQIKAQPQSPEEEEDE